MCTAAQPLFGPNSPALLRLHLQTRSSINVALWTPDGRRCLTGTQVGGAACIADGVWAVLALKLPAAFFALPCSQLST